MLGSGVLWIDAVTADRLGAEVATQGWRSARCALAADSDKAGVIAAIADSLDFPDWTGRNLDALADSITDLSWIDESQVMLIIDGAGALDGAMSSWTQIREILIEAAEWWHAKERTLVVAITSPAPTAPPA